MSMQRLIVRAGTVHLVDKCNSRNPILVGLPPHRFRLRLNATNGTEYGDSAIQHAQRALDFSGEIDVTRRIDDVDAMVVPEAGRRGGSDRDAAFLFLFHPVHRCGAFMHLTDLVVDAGVVQDPLRRGGLAGIDVRHDADVSCFFECSGTRHKFLISPPVMRESLVGLRHAVSVFLLLNRIAAIVGGVHQFTCELLFHGFFATGSRVGQNPANRQRCSPSRTDFDRHLVGRTAHAAGLHFQDRLDVFDRLS